MSTPVSVSLSQVIGGALRRLPQMPRVVRGLPAIVDLRTTGGQTHWSWIARNARRWPYRTAVDFEGRRFTWSMVAQQVQARARGLHGRGVQAGDVVALLCPNGPELLWLVGALARLGAVAALVPPEQRGGVLAHSVHVAGAAWVVVHPGLEAAWQQAEGGAAHISTDGLERAQGGLPPVLPRAGDPLLCIYTSGTTGLPKAARMSHQRWCRAAAAYGRMLGALGTGDVLYVPLPMHHHIGITVGWGSALCTGATLAFRERFSAGAFWRDCWRTRATAIAYIGEVPAWLLAAPADPYETAHRVRRAMGVGLRADQWQAFQGRFGIAEVFETYGASESNLLVANGFGVPGSVGFCISPYRLVAYDSATGQPLRGPDGRAQPVDKGQPGLLVGKVTRFIPFEGYTDPTASQARLATDLFAPGDAWFVSGDVLRDLGWRHLGFVDRLGDTFRWKSENISTRQVEGALADAPGVAECTVYGVEVPGQPGRAGMAAVVWTEDGPGADLAAQLIRALPAAAVPIFLRSVDVLSTTRTFKHRKVALQAQGWQTVTDVLVLDRARARYQPLDPATRDDILAGRLRL